MELTCLTDNTVDRYPFWGEHGLAMLIESEGRWLLFDTGSSGTVLLHNVAAAHVALASITGLVLSHGHGDHTGGLADLLERRPGLPIYAHPSFMQARFTKRQGRLVPNGLALMPSVLHVRSRLHLSASPQEVIPGVWTTGEITDRAELEGRGTDHVVRQGEDWVPDLYRDDLSLALHTSKGLVLVCGCCHAGLLNVLQHVRAVFGEDPVAVVGGTHLVTLKPVELQHVIDVLRTMGPTLLYLNHCTGQAATVALTMAFGERVRPCPAGTVIEF